jgi:hypothetical protein
LVNISHLFLKAFITPSNLEVKVKIAWEALKTQLTLNKKAWVLHHMLSLP